MSTHPLEPDRAAMEAMGRDALGFTTDFLEGRPCATPNGVNEAGWYLAERLLAIAPPERGRSIDVLLGELDETAARAIDTTGPGCTATRVITPAPSPVCLMVSSTIRTARSRSSGGCRCPDPCLGVCRFDVDMGSILPKNGASICRTQGSSPYTT